MEIFFIWTSGSGGNAVKRYFLSRTLVALFSAERNHFCRGYYKEQFCEIIVNLGQWFRKRYRLNISYM